MPSARKLSAPDKARILRGLPQGTERVQVVDSKGKTCWRKVDAVQGKDTILFGNDGNPVVMRGTPGRRKKPQLEAVNDNIAEVLEAKAEHLKDDDLTSAIAENPDSDSVLDIIMRDLAQEAASLEFERREAERNGRDTSTYSLRRANILKATGEMFIKRREKIESGMLDIDAPVFEVVFGFMLETFREALEESGTRPELIETVFAKLGKRLREGWKQEAKARMREAR